MGNVIVTLFFCLLFYSLSAQSVIRQSIGTLGKSYQIQDLTVQQSVGHAFNTKVYYSSSLESRPGFIQPQLLIVEPINSTLSTTVELLVYPNPTSDNVAFITEDEIENVTLEVFNSAGQCIQAQQLSSLNGFTLNCSQWPGGTYFIRLNDNHNQTYYSKLIKS